MKSPFFENETFVSLNAPAKIAVSGTTEISSTDLDGGGIPTR